MSTLLDPIESRDFSGGRISKNAVATALMPNYSSHSLTSAINSVSNSINVDFSEIIGSGIVRKGKSQIVQIGANLIIGQEPTVLPTTQIGVFGTSWAAQGFTLAAGQSPTVAFNLRLYRVGTVQGFVILRIQGSTGTAPNGIDVTPSITLDASQISTVSGNGIFYAFYLAAGTFLTVGTPYYLVLEYPSGDGSHNIEWKLDSTALYLGGNVQTSPNSGSTWSSQPGVLRFEQIIVDTTNFLPKIPLGNFSFLGANIGRNVVAFNQNQPFTNQGVIYYWDHSLNVFPMWRASTLSFLNPLKLIRFTNMNGSVFEANGSDPMHDSADFGATWGTTNSITTNSVIPSLLIVAKNRMLASGFSTFGSRVYFSSLVDPVAPGGVFITWNTDPSIGDFIDINPDDGGVVTGMINISTATLVFKNNAMYRLNAITKTVDSENIFNVGAVSQEAITSCLGVCYFYSGKGIYSTDGTFPQQISRIGVQDFIDAIADPIQVYAWSDEFNVYFSIGSVTITFGPEDIRSYDNVVLKFSPRDQNWQILTYNQRLAQTSTFGPEPLFPNPLQGEILPGLLTTEYDGYISFVNNEKIADDNKAIPYDLETQELEFGNRSHTKDISDNIVVYTRNGGDGMFLVKQDDGNFVSAGGQLNNRINVFDQNVNFEANFFTFRLQGQALGSRPVFEGYHLPKVTDLGVTKNE